MAWQAWFGACRYGSDRCGRQACLGVLGIGVAREAGFFHLTESCLPCDRRIDVTGFVARGV